MIMNRRLKAKYLYVMNDEKSKLKRKRKGKCYTSPIGNL